MATTRRERNENFFVWQPVDAGESPFTPNAPLDWLYEVVERTDSPSPEEGEEREEDVGAFEREEDVITVRELRRITPSNDELLRAAKMFPPPPEWFEEDQERPF
jgi:hypothetical protein